MATEGEVRINTRLNTDNIKKDLAKAEREIAKISKAFDSTTASVRKQEIALSGLQRKYNALMEGQKTPASLSAMQTSLRNTEREIREVEKANKDLFTRYEAAAQRAEALRPFGETDEQFIKAQEQADILFKRLEPVEQKFAELNAKAQDLRQSIAGVKLTPETSAEAQLLADKIRLAQEQLTQGQAKAAGLEQGIASATVEADRLRNTLGESGGAESAAASINNISAAAQTAAKVTASAFKKIGSIIGGIATGAARAAKGVIGMAKNILTLGSSSRKASGHVGGLGKRLLGLASAAFVFNILRKGLRELSESMRGLLMANREFAASWNMIRVNMLTAFAPLWEVIEPAIVSFMQLLAQFTAVLARFMALLFGKTYQQAKDSAQAINDQADALNNVGGAAKDAAKQLAGFDEINKLSADTSGAGAGDVLDFSFEPPDVSWIDEFTEKLKSIFTVIDPEYWFDLGASLAKWIASALNSIPWDIVQNWAKNLAINLASFLNGFLGSRELWESIGHTLAQGLNTALIFLYNFLTTLDFYQIASAIGHGINRFINEFDWKMIGLTIAAGINGIFDFVAGLVDTASSSQLGKSFADSFTALTDNIKWKEIGTTIKNGIIGALTTIYTAVTGYNWGKLGSQFASLLNNAITDKSTWMKLGSTLASLFNAAISFLLNGVRDFKWAELGMSMGAAINKFVKDVKWHEVGQLFFGFFKGALDFIARAIRETEWDKLGDNIAEMIRGIDATAIAESFGELLRVALKAGFALLDTPRRQMAEDIEKGFEETGENAAIGFREGIIKQQHNADGTIKGFGERIIGTLNEIFKTHSPSKVTEELGVFVIQGFLNGIKSLIDNVAQLFQTAWSEIQKVWGAVSKWFESSVSTPVRNTFDSALKSIYEFFSKAWTNIKNVWNVVKGWFETNVINPLKNAFDAAIKAIQEFFKNAWTFIQGVWAAVSGWFATNVINPVREAFDLALKAIYDFFKNAWADIQGVWEIVSGWFDKNVIQPVTTVFNGVVDSIKKAFSDAWTEATKVWEGAKAWFEKNVTGPIGDAFAAMKKVVSDIFDALFGWIGDLLDKIGDLLSGADKAGSKAGGSSKRTIASSALFSPAISNIEIPRLSHRGIIDSATISMISEKGRVAAATTPQGAEYLKPILDRLEAIEDALRDFGGNQPEPVLNINGREFARATYDDFTHEGNRRGDMNTRINGNGVFAR